MSKEYSLRVGLVVEAARLLREKRQSDVVRETTERGMKMVQSTVAAVEGGQAQTIENLWKISCVLEIDLWVILRIATALPEHCTESPAGRAKALGTAIQELEDLHGAQH